METVHSKLNNFKEINKNKFNAEKPKYLKLQIVPFPKPQNDLDEKINQMYKSWKEEIKLLSDVCVWHPRDSVEIEFVIPFPNKMIKKKKAKLNDQPHKEFPDIHDLLSAFFEALNFDEGQVWRFVNIKKVWGENGQIILKR